MRQRALLLQLPLLALAPAGAREALEDGPPVDLGSGLAGLQLTDDDITNHERMNRWFGEAFHSMVRFDPENWSIVKEQLSAFTAATAQMPALSLAVGSALYSYFWWVGEGTTRVNLEAGEQAVRLVQNSIEHRECDNASLSVDDFLNRQCHMRWRQLMLLSAETGRHLATELFDVRRAAQALRSTSHRFEEMKALPLFRQFEALGAELKVPHDVSYNLDYYPHVRYGPVWPRDELPIVGFLERHFEDFKADLLQIMDEQTFWDLHTQAFVSETQFTPRDEDWQTVYLFVNGKWVDKNCEAAPRSCELLRKRPEIAQCLMGSAGAGFLRLRPGGRLKPHYGNGPRLTAHLGLVVPEAGDIHLQVGTATLRWQEGRAMVFDDTFVHSARHDGEEPRFVLLLWMCHPCDSHSWDNPPERQPEACHWPR